MRFILAGSMTLTVALVAAGCAGKRPPEAPRPDPVEPPDQIGVRFEAMITAIPSVESFVHDGAQGKKAGETLSFDALASLPPEHRIEAGIVESDWTAPLSPLQGARYRGSAVIPPSVAPGSYRLRAQVKDAAGTVVAELLADAPVVILPSLSACEALQSDLDTMVAHFAFDDYRLDTRAREVIGLIGRMLSTSQVRDFTLSVEGHCDERGTIEYNLALGERRAATVRGYLVSLGMLDRERIGIKSFGEERPEDPSRGEAAWAKNRRVEFKVVCGDL